MSYSIYADPDEIEIPRGGKNPKDRKKRQRPRRCATCHQNVEPDGYGEWVHSNTMLYAEYDAKGELTHVASAR